MDIRNQEKLGRFLSRLNSGPTLTSALKGLFLFHGEGIDFLPRVEEMEFFSAPELAIFNWACVPNAINVYLQWSPSTHTGNDIRAERWSTVLLCGPA